MIIEIRCHRLTAPLHTPFVTALRRATDLETTVVELVDDEGRRGFGEAPQVWRVTGESLAGAEACLSGPLADVVRGRSTDDLDDLGRELAAAVVGNFGAKAAMDVALHDLAAQRAGVSLPVFLGARGPARCGCRPTSRSRQVRPTSSGPRPPPAWPTGSPCSSSRSAPMPSTT